jgi:type I restriction enzyme, S subunit
MTQVKSLQTGIKFKDTPIGKIPVDWEVAKLGDIVFNFYNGGTPNTKIKEYWDGDIAWITGADFTNQKVGQIRKYITPRGASSSSTNIIPKGNLLVVTRTGVGKLAIAPFDIAISQDITGVIADQHKSTSDFIYWYLNHHVKQLKTLKQGTSINGILREDLASFLISLPPLSEQKKIAEILTTVDDAIEDTDRIIEKSKELKKGLMQKLLTRGIEHKKFKKTEIGEIPEEWDIAKLRDLYKTPIRDFGSFSLTKLVKYVDSGVPFLRSDNFRDGKFVAENIKFIQSDVHKALTRSIINSGTLMFTKIGNIGHADIYDGSLGECNSNATIAKIDIDESKAFPPFIRWVFNSKVAAKQYGPKIISTPPRINLGEISNLTIPMPSHYEQTKIAGILDNFENLAIEENFHKKELETLKKSLMQVLLTGRVRVKLH